MTRVVTERTIKVELNISSIIESKRHKHQRKSSFRRMESIDIVIEAL